MAAAFVPLIGELAPSVIDLITGLVHKFAPQAQSQLGSNIGTGAAKFGQVFGQVTASLNDAATAGQIPKALPTDDTIKLIIQAVVTSMKLTGALTSADASAAIAAVASPAAPVPSSNASTQTIVIKPGTSLIIQAASTTGM